MTFESDRARALMVDGDDVRGDGRLAVRRSRSRFCASVWTGLCGRNRRGGRRGHVIIHEIRDLRSNFPGFRFARGAPNFVAGRVAARRPLTVPIMIAVVVDWKR